MIRILVGSLPRRSEESFYSRRMRREIAGEAKFEGAHPHQRWLSYGRRSRCAVCWSSVARTSGSLRSSTTPWRIFGLDKSFKARFFVRARVLEKLDGPLAHLSIGQ